MGLVRNYRRCAWLVTYLNGASPALCRSFRPDGHELLVELDPATWYAPHATSLRMSDLAIGTGQAAPIDPRELAGGVPCGHPPR
jgi:gamma-glutamylcysteine synthetase